MRLLAIAVTLMALLPFQSHAAGNQRFHCASKSAELVFHTVLHGELAVGEYTVLNGVRADLPNEGKIFDGSLAFYNQNRIFEIRPGHGPTLEMRLRAKLFGDDPVLLESGLCVETN